MRNWNIVPDTVLVSFANGLLTGSQFYGIFKNTEVGGTIRNLLRENGVEGARRLAKRALQRRKASQPCVVSQ